MEINELERNLLKILGISDEQFEQDVRKNSINNIINKINNKVKTAHEAYEEALANPEITLDELKLLKIEQLDEACNQAIVNGFTYTLNEVEYLFSSSLAAQSNFQGTDALFKDGLITEAEWTVTNVATGKIERVIIDQANFNNIKPLLFQHINSNVSKLRNTLQPQVEAITMTTTLEDAIAELNAITWE